MNWTINLILPGTQCLDQGKDCSGYKTTLTWGVGVASRGKLRGLSLPIVNSTQKAAQADENAKAQEAESNASSQKNTDQNGPLKDDMGYTFGFGMASVSSSPQCLSPQFSASAPIPIPSMQNSSWNVPSWGHSDGSFQSFRDHRGRMRPGPAPLQRSMSYHSPSFDESLFSAPSTGSVSNFSDSDFPSPHELPTTPEETPCSEPFVNSNMDLYMYGQDPIAIPSQIALDVGQGLSSSNDLSLAFSLDTMDNQCLRMYSDSSSTSTLAASMPAGLVGDLGMGALTPQVPPTPPNASFPNSITSEFGNKNAQTWTTTIPSSLSPSFLSTLSPRTAYLVEYYANTICPILVAVDGTKNPYRVHILALAAASGPTLVNAIAALAANVLHVRNKAAEQSYSMSPPSTPRGSSDEAIHYRTASVNLFNAAVRDPAAAHDDSILATLVMLALFSISEAGIGKLKAQLPEVRQLLALRGSNTSQFSYWATMFFTWLDIMSATVKDKEAHLRSGTLDLLDFSTNLGALEYLSFCEGRMYKVIARMNRNSGSAWSSPESCHQSLNPFTGLPIASPLSSPPVDTPSMESMMNSPPTASDARQEFWSEWQHVRSRIRLWSRDPYSCPPTPSFASRSPKAKSEAIAILVTHASEVFRHAALLFAERSATPQIPASSPQIQQIVTSALHHLSSIPVSSALNKNLLWPLMVIGTDCVRPGDRDVIRLRCGESMRDAGFFGVLSGLDVMERVWSADDAAWDPQAGAGWDNKGDNLPRLGALGGQAGRWRRAMGMIQIEFSIV
jgi:transcription factor-like protein